MGAALQGILAQVEEFVRRPVERGARMRAFVDIADRTAEPVHDKTLEAFLARAERKGFRAGLGDFGQRDQPRAGRRLVRTRDGHPVRSEEHTSELQSLMRISYAVF